MGEIPVFRANKADPDQMAHFVMSDTGLHHLPMSFFRDTMRK